MSRAIRVGSAPVPNKTEQFFIDQLSDTGEFYSRKRMYGSGASWCPRQNFLHSQSTFVGDETVWSASSQLYMAVGSGLEKALVDGLYRNKRLLFNGLELPPCDPNIGGRIDLVYIDNEDRIAIAEVKSCGNLPTKENPQHLSQLMTYVAIGGYDTSTLLYVSRNVRNQRGDILMRAFSQPFDDETLLNTLRKIAFSQIAIDEKWLPPIPNNFTKSMCRYCPFSEFCWEGREIGDNFSELGAVELTYAHERADKWARVLLNERKVRHVASLRHLYRNVVTEALRPRIKKEIERYDTF